MQLVHARVVQKDCPECLHEFLVEAQSLGGLPLAGEVVMIPEHRLNSVCPHCRAGLKFEREPEFGESTPEAQREESDDDAEAPAIDTRMDATKNIGYPVREHGPYGSHPMHDDFNDESSADGSGIYPGVDR